MLSYTSQTRRAQSQELELPTTSHRTAKSNAYNAGAPSPATVGDTGNAVPTTEKSSHATPGPIENDDSNYILGKQRDNVSQIADHHSHHSSRCKSDLDDMNADLGVDDGDVYMSDSAQMQHYNALARRNSEPVALGKLRKRRFLFVCTMYSAPDAHINIFVTIGMLLLVLGNMFVGGVFASRVNYVVAWTCVSLTCLFSCLLMITEPGVYVRLKSGESDPLEGRTDLVYCRVCRLRRPPKTSHCYICNVCVLEHDHHCGILGCCVGVRNLRWFVLYCCTTAVSLIIGVYWQVRTIFNIVYVNLEKDKRSQMGATAGGAGVYSASPWRKLLFDTRETDSAKRWFLLAELNVFASCERDEKCFEVWRVMLAALFLVIDLSFGAVLCMLSTLYIALAARSMTRRMWNRHSSASLSSLPHSASVSRCPRESRAVWALFRQLIMNIKRIFCPPPSMFVEGRTSSDAALLNYFSSSTV